MFELRFAGGEFDTAEEAALAHDQVAYMLGRLDDINFPERIEEYRQYKHLYPEKSFTEIVNTKTGEVVKIMPGIGTRRIEQWLNKVLAQIMLIY